MTRGFIGALGAIGFGAVLGALIALTIDPTGNGLWVIGALIGGAVSYVTYDVKTIWWAIKKVSTGIGRASDAFAGQMTRIAWLTSNSAFWKTAGCGILVPLSMLASVCVIPIAVGVFFDPSGLLIVLVVFMLFPLFFGIPALCTAAAILEIEKDGGIKVRRDMLTDAWRVSPIFVFFYYPFVFGPLVVRGIGQVVKLIHNDVRATCFLYGSGGAAIGYFAGRALESGIWGPIIGAGVGMGVAALGHNLALKQKPIPVPKE